MQTATPDTTTPTPPATLRHAAEVWFGGRKPTKHEIAAKVAPAGEWQGLALYWAMMLSWQRETGLNAQ